jgi:hypothetical protein
MPYKCDKMRWKLPPKVKVYEALGCIADDHVKFISEGQATVTSSEGFRKYTVLFYNDSITSDDNGSKWRGYLGYPSIAVLMLKDLLPFNSAFSNALKGIKWYRLNKKFGAYEKTIKEAQKIAEERGIKIKELENFVDIVIKKIKERKLRKFVKSQRTIKYYGAKPLL